MKLETTRWLLEKLTESRAHQTPQMVAQIERAQTETAEASVESAERKRLLRVARDFLFHSLPILRKSKLTTDDAEKIIADIDREIGVEFVSYTEEISEALYETIKTKQINGPPGWISSCLPSSPIEAARQIIHPKPSDPFWTAPPQPRQPRAVVRNPFVRFWRWLVDLN